MTGEDDLTTGGFIYEEAHRRSDFLDNNISVANLSNFLAIHRHVLDMFQAIGSLFRENLATPNALNHSMQMYFFHISSMPCLLNGFCNIPHGCLLWGHHTDYDDISKDAFSYMQQEIKHSRFIILRQTCKRFKGAQYVFHRSISF